MQFSDYGFVFKDPKENKEMRKFTLGFHTIK